MTGSDGSIVLGDDLRTQMNSPISLPPCRVAIVHDYLTQRGGAERVVLALLRTFPGARLVTSLYQPEATFPEFSGYRVETSWLNRLPPLRRDARRAFPLLAPTFSRLNIDDVDVVIASSSGWAHGVRTSVPKVVYCYNPPRWLHQPREYLAGYGTLARGAARVMSPSLRRRDLTAAVSAVTYIGISTPVCDRIRRAYGREALLIPPPVTIDITGDQQPIEGIRPGFLLTVARPRGYKNTQVVIEAMRQLPQHRLVVVGSRDQVERVRGVGHVTEAQLRWLYANCQAVVSVSREDFGLTPLEANTFARPAVVLRAGGFLDTVVEGVTGSYVETASAGDVAAAIRALPNFDPEALQAHARSYGEDIFAERMQRVVTTTVRSASAVCPPSQSRATPENSPSTDRR